MNGDKRLRRGAWARWLTNAVPLTVLLTAVFYLQGRAYQRGYLSYFHIDASQMSITTAEATWDAYRGWSNGAARIVLSAWSVFHTFLATAAPISLACLCAAGILILCITHFGLHVPVNALVRRIPRPAFQGLASKIAFMSSVMVVYLLAVPTLLCASALAIVLPLVVAVEPFAGIGKTDAARMCDSPAQLQPIIPTLPGFDRRRGIIRLLWCASGTCAVIQANIVSVVPKSSIGMSVSVPIAWEPPRGPHVSYEKICLNKLQRDSL